MRPTRRAPFCASALSVAGLLALSACSASVPNAGGGPAAGAPAQAGQQAAPKVEQQQGAAPSVTSADGTVRADEARLEGGNLTVGLSMAAVSSELQLSDSNVTVSTNTGVTVPLSLKQTLTVKPHSQSSVVVTVPKPEGAVHQLTIMLAGLSVKVPVPQTDGAYVWAPAPLRQVGLAPAPVRFSDSEVTVESVRTSGLITEVAYSAQGYGSTEPNVDSNHPLANRWSVTEGDGTVHPVLSPTPTTGTAGGRSSGTLRFLGEIKPDTTELTIGVRAGSWSNHVTPVKVTLPSHADSLAEISAGDLTRPTSTATATLTASNGAKASVDRVDVLADSIQVHAKMSGGPQGDSFAASESSLTDSTGVKHLLKDAPGAKFEVPANGTLDATLVFEGSTSPAATSYTVVLQNVADSSPMVGTLAIPRADKVQPATNGAKLGQLGTTPTPAAPTLTATPLPITQTASPSQTPSPASGTLAILDSVDVPVSTGLEAGGVQSSIGGLTVPATQQVASGTTVDPAADVAAQRSLRELGAKKTPDGWTLALPETVLFDYNKADIKPDATATLDKVAKILAYYDRAKVAVNGHTDNTGEAAYNLDLSKKRAQAVADGLATKGVSSGRVSVQGFGATAPIAPNTDDAGKAKNRRVDIVLKENS